MFWLLALLAYLLGSLSFAILLSRLSGGPDPRASGSGNPGATNMLRVAGKKLAVLTLLGHQDHVPAGWTSAMASAVKRAANEVSTRLGWRV